MKFRTVLLFSLIGSFTLLTNSLKAQGFAKRYLNSIFNDTSNLSKSQLIVYPVVAYTPETSWELGFSSLFVYFAKQDTTNRLSEISGFTFLTLENQYGLFLDHAIYSDKNRWFFLGKLRFQSFPLFFHGIGANSPEEAIAKVAANQILIKERVLRQIKNNLFVGLEFDFQRLAAVDFVLPEAIEQTFDMPLGSEGSTNVGLGIGLVRDDRHNVLNVRKGFFSELAVLHYNSVWGSTFNFTSVVSDTRVFKPSGKNNVFAAQVIGQFNVGDVPFNQLALMGGESMMRGYYYGRYRDKNQVAAQVEYRFLPLPFSFTDRIGAAVFTGAGSVFNDVSEVAVSEFAVSGGAGLRFLLFPKKDIWIRTDLAFTREGSGFYVFIGESF